MEGCRHRRLHHGAQRRADDRRGEDEATSYRLLRPRPRRLTAGSAACFTQRRSGGPRVRLPAEPTWCRTSSSPAAPVKPAGERVQLRVDARAARRRGLVSTPPGRRTHLHLDLLVPTRSPRAASSWQGDGDRCLRVAGSRSMVRPANSSGRVAAIAASAPTSSSATSGKLLSGSNGVASVRSRPLAAEPVPGHLLHEGGRPQHRRRHVQPLQVARPSRSSRRTTAGDGPARWRRRKTMCRRRHARQRR